MSARDAGLETFLARLYVDDALYTRFLADPEGTARRADLTAAEIVEILQVDRVGLELARESYSRKRMRRHIKEKTPFFLLAGGRLRLRFRRWRNGARHRRGTTPHSVRE